VLQKGYGIKNSFQVFERDKLAQPSTGPGEVSGKMMREKIC